MIKRIDWTKVKEGDILPAIADPPFPSGGKVKHAESGISPEGVIFDFWVVYPNGEYRFTVMSGKIISLCLIES